MRVARWSGESCTDSRFLVLGPGLYTVILSPRLVVHNCGDMSCGYCVGSYPMGMSVNLINTQSTTYPDHPYLPTQSHTKSSR